jgi:hypothetical protein
MLLKIRTGFRVIQTTNSFAKGALAMSSGKLILGIILCGHLLWAGDTTGPAAIDFSLQTVDGDTFTLSEYEHRVRVLYFFGCG